MNKVLNIDVGFSVARYFRDAFEEIIKKAQQIESDKNAIELSDKKPEEKKAELDKLFDEEYDINFYVDTKILEENGVKVTPNELALFDFCLPKGVKGGKKK